MHFLQCWLRAGGWRLQIADLFDWQWLEVQNLQTCRDADSTCAILSSHTCVCMRSCWSRGLADLRQDQCAECNPGYGLDESGRCSAYECKTGEADQCKTCKAFELRTGHNQCAECSSYTAWSGLQSCLASSLGFKLFWECSSRYSS